MQSGGIAIRSALQAEGTRRIRQAIKRQEETARRIALALREEVGDLEAAGIKGYAKNQAELNGKVK